LINEKRVLAVITARGGSKGVPRKNIRDLAGKPLICWTIDAAKDSKYIDRLILSSDDDEIIEVARAAGCEVPFIRPKELASDEATGVDTLIHAVKSIEEHYDLLVLLQPTSPFRSAADIDGAIEKCSQGGANSCVSVSESVKHPAWMYTLGESGLIEPFMKQTDLATRRQDLEPVFALNGAVYVVVVKALVESEKLVFSGSTLGYSMPADRSFDIDTEFDFSFCALLAQSGLLDR